MPSKAVKPTGGRPTTQDLQKMEQDYEKAYNLYQLTRSYREVGKQMGVYHKTAREYIDKHDAWLAATTGNDNQLRRFNQATLDWCIARLMRQTDSIDAPDVVVKTTAIIERLVRTQNQMLGLNKPVSVQVEHQINVIPWGDSLEGRQAVIEIARGGTSLEMDA